MRPDQFRLWHTDKAIFYQRRAATAAEHARFYFDHQHSEQAKSSQASARNFAEAARYHVDVLRGEAL